MTTSKRKTFLLNNEELPMKLSICLGASLCAASLDINKLHVTFSRSVISFNQRITQ